MYPFRDFDCVIRPSEISMLQGVFETELARTRLRSDTEEAETLARRLVALYQEGVRDPNLLAERLRDR
ncbi:MULTISPECIES: hypothetical protein [Sinorhizobium]|uniref:Uncharacterized protein n=2 Tax=Sinorhizobium TaxID=28105 RepID=A0A2S3YRG2_9HYPH|nr:MULTISPECIES: hypothetical protein [Sinorhizobium]ASY60215.1 hypothetical protein SS05631_b61230 [Sinorhizobium sp. CCBAU 05631]AUX80409.1 hypothetical protein NXT3_PC01256 [Sinorhizobium fredii]PDT43236.1 hypothetical protein CO656_00615 [Sinorhizobium sp. FG01]PDT52782.1 hypothetical protein CO664_10490 [Sinorhizobium sp. NG07B]POH28956.1 hypothetical protein ATY30_15000 [Sinorhizobium americanum]